MNFAKDVLGTICMKICIHIAEKHLSSHLKNSENFKGEYERLTFTDIG